MSIRLDQICRENMQTYFGTEYILIDDIFEPSTFAELHAEYLEKYSIPDVVDDAEAEIVQMPPHTLSDMIALHRSKIIRSVNAVWNETCVDMTDTVNLMYPNRTLRKHNDMHWSSVPVRGVLYLHDTCGTTFYSERSTVDLGGKANQLLLFKVSENSVHSVGFTNPIQEDRLTISLMFNRTKGKH